MDYVIATSRPWNEVMAHRLAERTGHTFHLITRKEELTPERLERLAPRYVFFPHWSYLVPEAIHQAYECVIFHMTDLPYGRGGSPLQNLIQRGHTETKLTALRCVQEIDAGPVYLKRPLCLEGSASEIFLRAASEIEAMIETIIEDEPEPQPQEGEPVVFRRRRPEESDLAEASVQDLNDFFDFIRMLDAEGYPRAFLDVHGHRMEFSRVQMESDRLVGTFTIYRQDHIPDNGGGGLGPCSTAATPSRRAMSSTGCARSTGPAIRSTPSSAMTPSSARSTARGTARVGIWRAWPSTRIAAASGSPTAWSRPLSPTTPVCASSA